MTRLPAVSTLSVRGPDSLPALVPHLVGFHPTASAVVVGLGPERHAVRVTMRLDLPSPDDAAAHDTTPDDPDVLAALMWRWTSSLAALPRAGAVQAVIAIYPGAEDDPWRGPVAADLPHPDLVEALEKALADAGVDALDAVCVVGDRIRSYWCDQVTCCPPEGRLVDAGESLRVRATLVAHGSAPLSSRDALVHTLDERPVDDPRRRAVDRARDGVLIRMPAGTRERVERVIDGARSLVVDPRNDATLVRLVVLVTWVCDRIRPRDLLLRALTVEGDPKVLTAARTILTEAVRCASGPDVAPVAAVLGVCAWVQGDGAAARVALDRALDADPAYSLASLVSAALDGGIPPWSWVEMMAETSVEEILGEVPRTDDEDADWVVGGA